MTGILGGVLGIGGGAILIPVLTVLGGFPWQEAYAISLFSIISSSLWVSYQKIKKDLVNLEWALYIESFGCFWAIIGSLVAVMTGGALATETLLALSTFFAVHMLWRSIKASAGVDMAATGTPLTSAAVSPAEAAAPVASASPSVWTKIGLSSACGLSSGLLGIGGGVVVVACSSFMKISMHKATATSSYAMGCMTMGALFGTMISGKMVWDMGLIAFVGTVVGSVLGVALALRISEPTLKLCFSVLLVGYTIYMWYQYVVAYQ